MVLSELKGIKSDVSGVKTEITEMNSEITDIKSDISGMKSEMSAMKVQQQENTGIIKALLHDQEVTNTTLENLEVNTATKEGFITLNSKIDALNTRIFHQEAELTKLRTIK